MVSRMRNAYIGLIYEDKEKELSNELSSITIIDNLSGVIDSIDIELKNDKNKLLSKENQLEIGGKLSLDLFTENWISKSEGIKKYVLGTYYIDERDINQTTGSIKALSIPLGSSQDELNTKTWGEISLQKLNEEFANKYKIKSFFYSKRNPLLVDIKQENEPDLQFLLKIAQQEGLNFKINANKLIMFDTEEYEKKEPNYDLDLNNHIYNFTENTKDIYTKVEVTYLKSKLLENEVVVYDLKDLGITPPGNLKEKVLKIKSRSKSGDLKKLAREKLLKVNRDRIVLDTSIIGKIDLYAGDIIKVKNAGIYSGNYMLKKVIKTLPGLVLKISAYKIWGKEEK